nr:PREDICTED: erythroblast NAD(P)(+)--arginine ADP-ribosyltransferase-like isoform X2 [Latimeria chalumnae]|eukprot:XP_006011782.1 PREDICTED: erythroblast NAD(P)(+)--arginine ADP-ribosyltransferase-like isoform X2 [Latimeria chalumnae]
MILQRLFYFGQKMKPLLLFCVLFALSILILEVRSQHRINLTMAPHSFDDQYIGCEDKMQITASQLFQSEQKKNAFQFAWDYAAKKWNTMFCPVANGSTDYCKAILKYTLNSSFAETFSSAMQEGGISSNSYLQSFHYKAFHFYLTRAIRFLKTKTNPPAGLLVYIGSNHHFIAKENDLIRFGQFMSASRCITEAQKFGSKTTFFITTQHGAFINPDSFFPAVDQVIIPPYEVFIVKEYMPITRDGIDKIIISLGSNGINSTYNCEYLKGFGTRNTVLITNDLGIFTALIIAYISFL